jgi:hypothetical protein
MNASPYQSRIVGHGEEAPESLLANPKNFRRHPRHQQDALHGILTEIGVVQSVIVNQRTNTLVDGHLRVELAMRHNQPTIPVVYVDLSPEEEDIILASLDPLASLAFTDADAFADLFQSLNPQSEETTAFLSTFANSLGIDDQRTPPESPDAFPTFDEDLHTDYQCPKCHYEWSGKPK